MAAALGRPARVALLKGRANYLCRHRLERIARASSWPLDGRSRAGPHARAHRSAGRAPRARGDLAEVPRTVRCASAVAAGHLHARQLPRPRAARSSARCHVVAARRVAQEADVVVVNHHLLLADLALKEDGFGDILGSADARHPRRGAPDSGPRHAVLRRAASAAGASSTCCSDVQRASSARTPPRRTAHGAWQAPTAALARCRRGVAAPARRAAAAAGRFAWADVPLEPRRRRARSSRDALHELHAALAGRRRGLPARSSSAERVAELAASPGAHRRAWTSSKARARWRVTPRGFTLSLMPFDISQRFQRAHRGAAAAPGSSPPPRLSLGEDFSALHRPARPR